MTTKKDSFGEFIKVEWDATIATLIINRENKLNALSHQVLQELKMSLIELSNYSFKDLQGVIFTGAGEKAFIAGADIEQLSTLSTTQAKELSILGQEVSLLFEGFNRPTIAAVNGHAMGGGLEMALSCDFIFMTSNASVALPEVKLGLIPGFGGTKRLADVVGAARAKELIFSGRVVKAQEAFELGIALQLFSTKVEMIGACKNWLNKTSSNSLKAVFLAKKAIKAGLATTSELALQSEADYFSKLFGSSEMLEGTKAFMEKRAANFSQE